MMSTTTLPPAHHRTGAIRAVLHKAGLPYDLMPLGARPAPAPGLPDHDLVYLPRLGCAVWVESAQAGYVVVVDGLTGDAAQVFPSLPEAAAGIVAEAAREQLISLREGIRQLDPGDRLQRWLYTRLERPRGDYFVEYGHLSGNLAEFAGRADGTTEQDQAWEAVVGIIGLLEPHIKVTREGLVKVAAARGYPIHPDHRT